MKSTVSARAFAAALLVGMAPVSADAQNTVATITGKVVDSAGAAINNATVYINAINASANTGPNGVYTLVINSDQVRIGMTENLRVRAVGYGPEMRTVRFVAGTNTVDFKLRGDGRMYNEVAVAARVPSAMGAGGNVRPTMITDSARVRRQDIARLQALESAQGGVTAVAPGMRVVQTRPGYAMNAVVAQGDPFGRNLFTAEQVMQYQDAIALKETQRSELQKAVEEAQSQTTRMQWALAQDTEKLSKMLSEDLLVEKDVMAQMDRIMAIEREIKRAQMMLMIRIKNTLTTEQQTKLRQLR